MIFINIPLYNQASKLKIAVIKIVSQELINKCISDKINVIVYGQLSAEVDYKTLKDLFKLINAFDDVSGSNWFSFNLVSQQLINLKIKLPSLFTYSGIDLEEGLQKDIWWSLLVDYALLFQIEKLKTGNNEFIYYSKRNSLIKKLSLFKNLFFDNSIFYATEANSFKEERTKKIAFRINNSTVPTIYGMLLDKLGKKNVISFQSDSINKKTELTSTLISIFSENISTVFKKQNYSISFYTKLKILFTYFDKDFLITFLINYKKLCNHIDEYEKLFQSGVKKIVFNAGENEGEATVACLLAKKHNAKMFNYMNGTKGKDPQHQNTYFDYWFMPDEKTQKLILSYCNVSENQIPVVGHLLQELAQKHSYFGTLDKYSNRMENKKIIALFTSPIFVNEIQSVITFLASYLNKHNEVVVLIRKHPSQNQTYNLINANIIELEKNTSELMQISLFDLLLKSHIAISFSSTVSWQASWFGIPSLNYELSEKSRLSFVDNEKVMQINSIEKLEAHLNNYLFVQSTNGKKIEPSNVAEKISNILLSV